ncbi:hypothetical protein [Psychroflexus halocasei]|uniref:AsmA-like C-terminal region n=1 Tax=Psychroflexus halocasei TaxID=908615 RepID=A0A1H4AJ89_9FLAO|nr:hypothetical protein [Psychroflexus halocasei]SEA36006.1 hypothetical protein SAMN05421540_10556 [Psychroflexus halocasei]
MKKKTKYLFSILIILGVYVAAIIIAEYFIEKKVNTEYDLKYSQFNLSLTTNLKVEDLHFVQDGIDLKAESIKVNLGLWSTLFSDKTVINKVDLHNAKLNYTIPQEKKSKNSNSKSSKIDVNHIYLEKFNAIIIKEKDTIAEIANANFELSDPLSENFNTSNIDFFSMDELHFRLDKIQDLSVYNFDFAKNGFDIDSLHIDSDYTKGNYINQLSKEKDLIMMKSYGLHFNDFSFDVASKKLSQIAFKNIAIDSSQTLIYRDKTIADDESVKETYGQKLQNLDFDLSIDELSVDNSQLTYSEKLNQKKTSEIVFKDLSVTLRNFHNLKEKSDEQMKLIGSLSLSQSSKLDVGIAYNQFADLETFQLDLNGKSINTESLNQIMKPSMNFGLGGYFKKINAKMVANNNARGTFDLTAKDLELTIYSDSGREKKIMSFMANKLLNNNISEEIEIEEVERNPTKSMWNFIWNYIKSGLTKILL